MGIKKSLLLTIVMVMCGSLTYGQDVNQPLPGSFTLNPKSDGIKGSPYLFETPQLGMISLGDGKIYEDIPFNILLENNEVFIHMSGENNPPLAVKKWEWIKTSEENPRVFRKEVFEARPRIFEIIFENDTEKIVALHSKRLIKPTGQKDGYSGPQYETYVHNINFYRLKGLQAEEIKTNNSGLKEISGDQYTSLKKFMKEEKLNSDQPQDLKLVFEFLNKN